MNPQGNNNSTGYGVPGDNSSAPSYETYDPVPETTDVYGQATTYNQYGSNQGYANPTAAQGYADSATAQSYAYPTAQGYANPAMQNYDAMTPQAYADPASATATQGYNASTDVNQSYTSTTDTGYNNMPANTADMNYDINSASMAGYGTNPADATGYSATPGYDGATANGMPAENTADSSVALGVPQPTENNSFSSYTSANIANSASANLTAAAATAGKKSKKSNEKKGPSPLIIILVLVLAVAGIVAGVVFLLPMLSGNSNSSSTKPNNSGGNVEVSSSTTLTCSASANADSLVTFGNPNSATQELVASYTGNDLDSVSFTVDATYSDALQAYYGFDAIRGSYNSSIIGVGLPTDPFSSTYRLAGNEVVITHEATASELNSQSARIIPLSINTDGTVATNLEAIQTLYASNGYQCATD